jgi:hypothetical protein
MAKKRARNIFIFIALLWDTGWKVAAIRKALQKRQFRWIGPLALVNSLGLLPMLYLRAWAGRD